jgi:uncharacterized protein YgbK (DUF1537 family)
MYIGIVADDLTGAADSIAPFAGADLRATVWLNPNQIPERDALAVVTGARDAILSPEQRDSIVREAVQQLLKQSPEILYQKIDSTLRGDVTGEMAAIRAEIPERTAIVCPAFPANGRTVSGGRLYVHGNPWSQTSYAPASLQDDCLLSLICPDPCPRGAHIALDEIRSSPEALRARLRALRGNGIATITCDAVTNDDLETLTRAVLADAGRYLLVGSGGWTGAMARLVKSGVSSPMETEPFASGRVLVVIGSRHEVSRTQTRHLCAQTGCEPILLEGAQESATLVLRQFHDGCRVVVVQSPDLDLEESRRPAVTAFAQELQRATVAGERSFDAVIVTGGETAIQLCRGLNVSGLEIKGEVAAGVVVARTIADTEEGRAFDHLPLILKSGGFGATDLLASCVGGTGFHA